MIDNPLTVQDPDDTNDQQNESLDSRLEKLERDAESYRLSTEQRILHAEMKVEAVRAGMIDLDGLRFLDMGRVRLNPEGTVNNGKDLIADLKRAKPWLFPSSSSSTANAPQSVPARQKLVREMSTDGSRIARANIIKRALP